MTSRKQIIEQARTYLGVPYLHQGRTLAGLDCIGLFIRFGHDLGLSDFDIDGYSRVPSGRMMARLIRDVCTPIRPAEAQIADMIHLAFGNQPQHLALITDKGMIHADSQRGVVEHRLDETWRGRIRGWYRLPGVTD